MAGLQGRVGIRTAEKPVANSISTTDLVKEVASILHPMLVMSLHPQTFTGDLGVSIHVQDGSVCHVKEFSNSKLKPGDTPPRELERLPQKLAASGEKLTDNVLESATRDLRLQLTTIAAGYFGVIVLTLEIDRGVCTLVTCGRERVHRRNPSR